MSEYWKSTPKYWCKHCSIYVRDTKLERSNHEATAKHQGALKRSLRNLHREHERGERDKERAQREIARLNGIVTGAQHARQTPAAAPETQLKAQREQLAALGVAVPDDFRGEMAMPGEWTVTSTRVLGEERGGGSVGVRKREGETEEKREEEEAIRGLFKRPRRWGRDSKMMPEEGDEELDALLSGAVPLVKRQESQGVKTEVKKEEGVAEVKEEEEIKKEEDVAVKDEPDTESGGITQELTPKQEPLPERDDAPTVKTEEGCISTGPAVMFKKRRPKGIRSK